MEGRRYGIPAGNPFADQPLAQPEIWLYGLRNPWRMSFDRATGDLWIGDVGQGALEEVDVARAKVSEAAARYRVEQFSSPVKAELVRQQLEHEQRVLERAEERYGHLFVRAEAEGVLTAPKPQDMEGQFFKKGELLGYVLDRQQFIARVVVVQDNIDLVRTKFKSVELRLADTLEQAHEASVIREMPGGVDELPSPALGRNGGGPIPVDPKDSNGQKTLERVFVFDLKLPPGAEPKAFGERVHVRFDHGGEPLASQAYRRVRQLFLTRFNV